VRALLSIGRMTFSLKPDLRQTALFRRGRTPEVATTSNPLANQNFQFINCCLCGSLDPEICWAHARRKFYEARNSDPARSAQALAYIRLLYDVEDQAKEKHLDAAARDALRQQLALPRLIQFKAWLEAQQLNEGGGVLPKSPIWARRSPTP